MKIDYQNPGKEPLEVLLEKYNPNKMFLIIEDVLSDPRGYDLVLQQLIDMMKWAFEIREVRTRPIHFKFRKDDEQMHTLPTNNFISNLICWYPFMEMDCPNVLDETYIIDFTKPNTIQLVVDFMEEKAFPFFEGDIHSQNKLCDEVFYNISCIAKAFCKLMGMSMSLYDISRAAKINPEINDIIFGKIDPNLQPIEVERELNRRTDRLQELFAQTECDLKPLLISGNHMSKNQFKEMLVMIGMKTDINDNTIPFILQNNLVVGGLSLPSYQYIEATSGRKSLILQKQSMGDPGAFSKRVNMVSTSPGILRPDYEFCNSVTPVTYEIKDDMWLNLLDKRFYYNSDGELTLLNAKTDKHLLHKKIEFASPCTCNSPSGICRKCYGTLFDINNGLASVGSYAATKDTEPLGQSVLSSKHSQKSDSDPITLPQEFFDIFELNSVEVSLSDNPKNDDELFLVLDQVEVEKSDDKDLYFTKEFRLVDRKGSTVYTFKEDHDANFYFSERLTAYYRRMKNPSLPIPLDDIVEDDDSRVFQIEVKSKGVTEPFKMFEQVLRKENTSTHTVSEICQMLGQTLMDIGIKHNLVHMEVIVRSLIRRKSDIRLTPDWSRNGDPDDVTILSIINGLKHNPSPLVSISYGYLKQQIVSSELYERNAPSHLDAEFVRDLKSYMYE